jgi:hypothetical protein
MRHVRVTFPGAEHVKVVTALVESAKVPPPGAWQMPVKADQENVAGRPNVSPTDGE